VAGADVDLTCFEAPNSRLFSRHRRQRHKAPEEKSFPPKLMGLAWNHFIVTKADASVDDYPEHSTG
jgi:hypothetical protein